MRLKTCITVIAVITACLLVVAKGGKKKNKGNSWAMHQKLMKPTQEAEEVYKKNKKIREQGSDGKSCVAQYKCVEHARRYRTIDGSCNNLERPFWGVVNTPFRRLLKASYRRRTTRVLRAKELPSPRLLSATIVKAATKPNQQLTLMAMQVGQFLDHDITHTPTEDTSDVNCCEVKYKDRRCAPITIPENDDFFSKFQQKCMNFSRSIQIYQIDSEGKCIKDSAEQMNQVTTFIDASSVYDSTKKQSEELYDKDTGLMHVNKDDLLPQLGTEKCGERICFKAGDERVNEQPALATIHTIFVREHNRIAEKIRTASPEMRGEIVYEETRRIIGAIWQRIVYTEYLPLILGKELMDKYELNTGEYKYNASIDPRISNAFAAAAFRFGHSLLPDKLKIADREPASMFLSDVFDNTNVFHEEKNSVRKLTLGLLESNSQLVDSCVTEEVTDRLFKGDKPFGLDLVSLNIQRGRDHGLPRYIRFRKKFLGSGHNDDLSKDQIRLLKAVYNIYSYSDLFLAGIMEKVGKDSQVGRTFGNIIGEQFNRLKYGDAFFYERTLNKEELTELEKMSLGNVLCKSALSPDDEMTENVFLKCNMHNVKCRDMKDIDVNVFLRSEKIRQ